MLKDRKQLRRLSSLVIIGFFTTLLFCLYACGQEEIIQPEKRSDVLTIDTMRVFGELERQPVAFSHDLHTQTLKKQNKDCSTCHLSDEKGVMSQKFQRLEDIDKQAVMEIYHEKCIECHKEIAGSGQESGPVTCGECHLKKPKVVSSQQAMRFDLSLHHRHSEAMNGKCETCHHKYDDVKKKLFYEKGKESSCRDCHREEIEENRKSMRLASHQACIGCHLKVAVSDKAKTGPQVCSGCHDPEKQQAIRKIEEVPRLKRGQPDAVLLRTASLDLKASKMNTVPFNHEAHEGSTSTCRDCHHETLKACKECHTLKGEEKGKGVKLERSMHDIESGHSCVGCHEAEKFEMQCAGCHALMEKGLLSESACKRCHVGPPPGAPTVGEISALQVRAMLEPRAEVMKLSFSEEDVPENVTIKVLAEKYEPSVFPHRKIVKKLIEYIGNSRLATHFHGSQDAVCQGCHHHTPVGNRPPYCSNCHGKPFNELNLYMPGLFGAYHQQCMGCHQKMEIKNVSECTSCHKKREK